MATSRRSFLLVFIAFIVVSVTVVNNALSNNFFDEMSAHPRGSSIVKKNEKDALKQERIKGNVATTKPEIDEWCKAEESVLLENHSEKVVEILHLMGKKYLCQSFKQQEKFSRLKDKVITWIRSNPEKEKEMLYGPPGKNNYAVVLNEKYAFRHIFKNGGTSVQTVTGGGHIKLDALGNRSVLAVVRDPIDHFLSGWAECGFRFTNTEEEPSFSPEIDLDTRIQNFVKAAKSCLVDPRSRKREICLNVAHAYPQAVFLLDPYGGESFDPNVKFIGHLHEMSGLLKMVGFGKKQYKKPDLDARSASQNAVKVEAFPNDQQLLSDETLRVICEFVILDYYLFDFEPPVGCVSKVHSDMAMIEKVSSE